MPSFSQVQIPDNYNSVTGILQNCWGSRGGWFSVSGAPVFVELQFSRLNSTYQGQEDWTQEVELGAGAFATLPANCIGVQFRNAIPGTPATVTAQIAVGDEPPLAISAIGIFGQVSGIPPTITVINAGTTTYTTPPNCIAIYVECIGGGAPGAVAVATGAGQASAGGGGGGGGYAAGLITHPAASYPCSVAAAAGSGSSSNPTSFGAGPIFNANGGGAAGGAGGTPPNWFGNGGAGGLGTLGTKLAQGSPGAIGEAFTTANAIGGSGGAGAGYSGGGGQSTISAASAGIAGGFPGGGGSGAANGQSQGTQKAGGIGAAGVIYVTEFY